MSRFKTSTTRYPKFQWRTSPHIVMKYIKALRSSSILDEYVLGINPALLIHREVFADELERQHRHNTKGNELTVAVYTDGVDAPQGAPHPGVTIRRQVHEEISHE